MFQIKNWFVPVALDGFSIGFCLSGIQCWGIFCFEIREIVKLMGFYGEYYVWIAFWLEYCEVSA